MRHSDSMSHGPRQTARIPKYAKIADDLRAAIVSGTLSPGDRLPSFSDMTQKYNVAKHTIERAHAILEQEGLVRREQGRGIFVEAPERKRTGYIGLLVRAMSQSGFSRSEAFYNDSYLWEVINGLQQQARYYDLNVVLVDAEEPIRHQEIDGIALYCSHLEAAALDLPATMPRVLLLERAGSVEIANVMADDQSGTQMLTRHLLDLGHRRISQMLVTNSDTYSPQRQAGYRAALEEFGIDFTPELISQFGDKFPASYFSKGEETMKQWLAQGWRDLNSTAILAPNDMAAFGIIKALTEAGLEVPGDVSVVGFDDIATGSQEEQQLTTAHVPLREIGAIGAQLLWDQIEQGGHQPIEKVIPVQLKIGRSTGPVAQATMTRTETPG